jgi:glyoxalase family protein
MADRNTWQEEGFVMQLTGIHHLTAVTGNAPRNHDFYTATLGLRLVKKTVNQDDVSAYHLFYADGRGSPGTDITFFDWPVEREKRGTNSITRTGLRVAGADTLAWWEKRFQDGGVAHSEVVERDGRLTLDFEDFEGQRLSLIDDGGAGEVPYPWERSSVPAEHQIRGLGPITISVPELQKTEPVLTKVMGMTKVRDYAASGNADTRTFVYSMGAGGASAELHVSVEPDLPGARPGAGGVHHVAFRIPDADYQAWAQRLDHVRMPSSGPVDRFWFRSLYFREPNGILFEIATEGPGFATDEQMEHLGETLSLPPFLEGRRREIEAGLKPL